MGCNPAIFSCERTSLTEGVRFALYSNKRGTEVPLLVYWRIDFYRFKVILRSIDSYCLKTMPADFIILFAAITEGVSEYLSDI